MSTINDALAATAAPATPVAQPIVTPAVPAAPVVAAQPVAAPAAPAVPVQPAVAAPAPIPAPIQPVPAAPAMPAAQAGTLNFLDELATVDLSADVNGIGGDFVELPIGDYNVIITGMEMKAAKKTQKQQVITTARILDGEYAGQTHKEFNRIERDSAINTRKALSFSMFRAKMITGTQPNTLAEFQALMPQVAQHAKQAVMTISKQVVNGVEYTNTKFNF